MQYAVLVQGMLAVAVRAHFFLSDQDFSAGESRAVAGSGSTVCQHTTFCLNRYLKQICEKWYPPHSSTHCHTSPALFLSCLTLCWYSISQSSLSIPLLPLCFCCRSSNDPIHTFLSYKAVPSATLVTIPNIVQELLTMAASDSH